MMLDHFHDLWDDVARPLNANGVVLTQILSAQLLSVVQRGSRDGDPSDDDRAEPCDRGR